MFFCFIIKSVAFKVKFILNHTFFIETNTLIESYFSSLTKNTIMY